MPQSWTHSAVDAGREFLVGYQEADGKWNGCVPRDLLDDILGDEADETERRNWIVENGDQILSALRSKATGGHVRKPFDRIVFKELS